MDLSEYDRELRNLGLYGPMGEMVLPSGAMVLIYKMPDGRSHKHLPPPDVMTPEQRAELIDELRRHLETIENNRRTDGTEQ